MAALTQDRDTPMRDGCGRLVPAAAGVRFFKGGMAVLDAGFAKPAHSAPGLIGLGRIEANADNRNGAAGEVQIPIRTGVFRFDIAPDDPITIADIGAPAYAVDDQSVARTSANATRSAVGVIFEVDDGGAWVKFS